MICAYEEGYLDDAMRNLGEAVDYAVNGCGMTADRFMELFIADGIAEQFGAGVPKYVSGMSGTELVCETVMGSGLEYEFPEPVTEYDCSPEYWCGWILAYYQWYSGKTFKDIMSRVSMADILRLYPTLHEAPEEKFVEVIDLMIQKKDDTTQLQALRRLMGYSQRMLAEKSGVSLRMIQQYEQRAKNINKASGESLAALARTMGCRMEDLLEQETME